MQKKTKHIIIVTSVSITAVVALLLSILQIGYLVGGHGAIVWTPDYEKASISHLLESQDPLSEKDYQTLYAQTGLTKIGIDRALAKGKEGKEKILDIHESYFAEYKVHSEPFGPWMNRDYVDKRVPVTYLEDGDILVTSSNHFSMVRVGHCGLVVDGARGHIIQALGYGLNSLIGGVHDFNDKINFMVLRPKVEKSVIAEVVKYAKDWLIDLPYQAFKSSYYEGFQPTSTQCAHLVWYAYKAKGVDLLDRYRWLVLPEHIANSSLVELVQVFGFDPVRLWNKQ